MDKITCSECHGSGKVPCETCDGNGSVSCKSCNGTGHIACPTCNGTGRKYQKCPSCHDGYNIDPDDDRKVKCAKCDGAGKIAIGDCADCKGIGRVPCKNCSESGKVVCSDCHGEGNASCSKCHGKGGLDVEQYCTSLIGCDGTLTCEAQTNAIGDHDMLEKAAHAGSGVAAYVLGKYSAGDGGDDYMDLFKLSTKADFVWGNYELGRMLYYENDPAAIKLLERAREQGCVFASGYLGMIHYFGLCGVTKNAAKAVTLCKAYHGSVVEKDEEDYLLLHDIISFMKNVEPAVAGQADALAWMAAAAYELLPDSGENECLAFLKDAVAKGAQNIEEVFKESRLEYAKGAIKDFKEQYDQECKRKEEEEQKASGYIRFFGEDEDEKDKKIRVPQNQKPAEPKTNKSQTKKVAANCSTKKRWKFVVLGLLFGWVGAHYMYAKRMFLLLLLWASFITGVAMIGSSQNDEKQKTQDASAEVAQKSNNNELIGGGCMVLWALLWLGGTFFVKKDGKGNRM